MKIIVALSLLGLVAACGKSVEIGQGIAIGSPDAPSDPTAADVPGPCTPQKWSFAQPLAQVNRAVDLLIVADSSSSLMEERTRIASKLPDFLAQLDPQTDLRVGVMLAHGGGSQWNGRLYSTSGIARVQSTRSASISQVQSRLSTILGRPASDVDEANGEAMLHSLSRSLDADRVAEIQGQGLFRTDAALSVLTVSDENDICYPPEKHGYTAFPDFVASISGWEAKAYEKYCGAISPAAVYSKLKAKRVQSGSGGRISLASITHVDPARVPAATPGGAVSEDAIGHGLIEFTSQAVDGKLMDLSDDWTAGMRALGEVVSVQQRLNTVFSLGAPRPIRSSSIEVRVDGQRVSASYDAVSRSVELAATSAGQAGSSIEISGCMAD